MRWYWQLGVIAVVGGLGYGAWSQWDTIRGYVPGLGGNPAVANAPPGAGGAPGGRPGGPPPAAVEVAVIGRGPVAEVTEAVGTTRAFESVTITTRVSGIVQRVGFDEGQLVEAGAELLQFDASERRADLEAALAATAQAEAQRNETAQRLERARQLRQSGAGTEAQVADLTATMRTADSAVVAAQARARAAEARLQELSIRAPFSGRIGVRQVSLGALVEPRTPIATLDDLSRIRLDFQVPETLVARLAVDNPISARTIAFRDREFRGRVAIIDTRIDPVTRSVRLTALIENPDMALRPGMFMNVALVVASRPDAILVPEEAVVGEGPRQVVFTVREGRVERRVIEMGQRQEGMVEVLSGVQPGEQVIVRGVQRVRSGMQVTARPVGAPGGPPAGGPPPGAAPRPQAQAPATTGTPQQR